MLRIKDYEHGRHIMSETDYREPEWRAMLKAVPVKNTAAKVVGESDKAVSVQVKNKKPGYRIPPISWFVPYKPTITIELDELGSRLWRCCDGEHDVEQICDAFSEEYGLSFHEAKTAVTDYLGKLIQRGVLAITMQEQR